MNDGKFQNMSGENKKRFGKRTRHQAKMKTTLKGKEHVSLKRSDLSVKRKMILGNGEKHISWERQHISGRMITLKSVSLGNVPCKTSLFEKVASFVGMALAKRRCFETSGVAKNTCS